MEKTEGGRDEAKQLIVVVPNGVILWHLKLGPLAAMIVATQYKQKGDDSGRHMRFGVLLLQSI